MKKTIAGMVLLASAVASAETNMADFAKANGLHVACVAAEQAQGRSGEGYVLKGSMDMTGTNSFFHAKLNDNGCADGQIQIITADEVLLAPTPVML